MQERHWKSHKYQYKKDGKVLAFYDIPANYYPIDTAIAIRDFSNDSNIQVTIMNDRPQAGSANAHQNNTIEIL